MLNDFSDRPPPTRRRPFLMSREFFFGVGTALIGLIILIGIFSRH